MAREIKKVLVANRGEIAIRIIRTLREMNIKSVAIYSDVDKESLHVTMADECICVGPKASKDSYLNKIQILNAALLTGCDAIHPGFGFLSENADFARMCEIYNVKFIGPSSKVIDNMGNKDVCKKMMKSAGLPIVPGSDGVVESLAEAKSEIDRIGLPVIIKARSGGGGKGMRIVTNCDQIENLFLSAQKEAEASFGDKEVYIEKYIESPRHIEVQIMADEYGNVVHLGARDCSIQMKHQKIIEEAPPFSIDQNLLDEIYKMSVESAKYVGYTNVGTIEYLVSRDNKVYFMEMNTRIQVEHPITEMITGIDIVREQIEIASQKKLKYTQDDIQICGHSIECRINAYDPKNNFMPSIGTIDEINLPGGRGIRIDSLIYQGYRVLPFYDSMLAKIISYDKTRDRAIAVMRRALDELVINGVNTNIDFNSKIINNEDFISGKLDTSFVDRFLEEEKKIVSK